MGTGLSPEDQEREALLAGYAWPGELHVRAGDGMSHILDHAGVDEPSGTWTGGACARHGRIPGSGVDLADLGEAHRRSGGLTDMTWYPEPEAADVYLRLIREWREDGSRQPHRHEFGWWAGQVAAMWSFIWAANCRFVTEIIERPARDRGGDGLLVASFGHNSSAHGLDRPHVHNLVPMRAAPVSRD